MRMARVLVAIASVVTTALPALAEPKICEVAGSDTAVVQGRLGLLEGLGPAAFIVTVPGGLCLSGANRADNVDQARSVQLYSNTPEGFQDLYRLVGENVYVRGKLSGGGTFQQKAPIIMEVLEIATR